MIINKIYKKKKTQTHTVFEKGSTLPETINETK